MRSAKLLPTPLQGVEVGHLPLVLAPLILLFPYFVAAIEKRRFLRSSRQSRREGESRLGAAGVVWVLRLHQRGSRPLDVSGLVGAPAIERVAGVGSRVALLCERQASAGLLEEARGICGGVCVSHASPVSCVSVDARHG